MIISLEQLKQLPPELQEHFEPLRNKHLCVKSNNLMKYLINLVTPPRGIVLDMFCGSGSTGISALEDGFSFIGIEKEKEFYDLSHARLTNCLNKIKGI